MYNVVVIGGGIVGLASALKIKEKNSKYKVAVIEKEQTIALHQTSHNSGVIHSGVYYPTGSLKAKNCIDGYTQLIRFCEEEGVNYELCGKVIVASHVGQLTSLDHLYERGKANGLEGIKKLNPEELKEIEPHVRGVGALYVPQTGIVDYKDVANKYAEKFKHFGGEIFSFNKLEKIEEKKGFIHVSTHSHTFIARIVINCGGLYSDKIAKQTGTKINHRIIPFRGEYYTLKKEKEHLVKNLVYPVPEPNFPFLGVHFTRMIKGGIEAGPNAVLAYSREGYKKSDLRIKDLFGSLSYSGFLKLSRKYWKTGLKEWYRSYSKSAFTKALQQLIPEIEQSDLSSGGAGVRAQACHRNGKLIDDFLIMENKNFINVCNAPSPAATSSLAIGEFVANKAIEKMK